ncbi:hypothetical protein AB0C21_25910 [Spirillospora sp. NPDC049024]
MPKTNEKLVWFNLDEIPHFTEVYQELLPAYGEKEAARFTIDGLLAYLRSTERDYKKFLLREGSSIEDGMRQRAAYVRFLQGVRAAI